MMNYHEHETMTLDWQICSRARLSRDARFDGKFFIGVRGSRVYCRSICPAPTAKEKNVTYFSTAAAAAEAGFRPCLRCRPEASPGTPAWSGTSNTVSRALRLIAESGLEEGGVEALAERLGVGSRHLRRLFLKHLGATPSAVAHTRRMHFAKKLIDETTLSMLQVALASGFGCVRRFNAAVRKMYRRTPTQIRRLARPRARGQQNEYHFQLRFRPPYDWKAMLRFLGQRAIPEVEEVQPGIYRRSISLNGRNGYFEVSSAAAPNTLFARIQFDDPCALFFIIERIRARFDLSADWTEIAKTLRGDALLGERLRAAPGMRVPGCWDGFEIAVQAILEQRMAIAKARVVMAQVAEKYGTPYVAGAALARVFPSPETLMQADLMKIGISESQAKSMRNLARAVYEGKICFRESANTESFIARLCELADMSNSAAQYVAMRALGEPDAFPAGEGRLMRALNMLDVADVDRRSEVWRPWRAYAAVYLWDGSAQGELRERKKVGIGEQRTVAPTLVRNRSRAGA
jgi:AraC family transcriptional regulator of adaptative response / DNA-3-methyladenine glycosylase II